MTFGQMSEILFMLVMPFFLAFGSEEDASFRHDRLGSEVRFVRER